MRRGFTLIEMVVVVLIIGIVAAVAVPRVFNLAGNAQENAMRQSLRVVRDAIEVHKAANGMFPGETGTEADFIADLATSLRRFPENPLKGTAKIAVKTDGAAITGTVTGDAAWQYDSVSGQFVANSNGISSDGVRRYWEL